MLKRMEPSRKSLLGQEHACRTHKRFSDVSILSKYILQGFLMPSLNLHVQRLEYPNKMQMLHIFRFMSCM